MKAHNLYDLDAAKKSVNVTANADLVLKAKKLGINLSSSFEKAIADELKTVLEAQWREESREGIAAYNRRVEELGVFGMEMRRF